MKKKEWILILSLLVSGMAFSQGSILIRDVAVFTGEEEALLADTDVLIEGNRITQIGTGLDEPDGALVLDGNGKTLMPGLIDAHYHCMFAAISEQAALFSDIGFVNIMASRNAENLLMQGVTSVRDLGGPVWGLKRAIDLGITAGPRIWPSGAFISQTGGHGDFRLPIDIPDDPTRGLSYIERAGVSVIADSPGAVRKGAREQLMLGASQLKLMAGGGVSSDYDPIDVAQYSLEELQAAVWEAENWGTYVAVHAYVPRGIRTALEAGVKCIEHGHLIDEATAKLMAEKDIWWSLQPFLDDEDANPKTGKKRQKQLEVAEGTDKAYALAKKYKIRTAWGTDVLFSPQNALKEGKLLVKLKRWYTPFELLKMATHDNGQLLALSGNRSPYEGSLGVIREGALADLIVVDGNPLEDIDLIADPGKNFVVIIKDGVIYKNSLSK